MPLVPLSVRRVSQVIPVGQQEGEHGVKHNPSWTDQGRRLTDTLLNLFVLTSSTPIAYLEPQRYRQCRIYIL